MKRTLLLFLLSIPVVLFAQKRKAEFEAVDVSTMTVHDPSENPVLSNETNSAQNREVNSSPLRVTSTLTKLGESANPFTGAFGFRSALSYEPALNMVSFVFRQNPAFYGSTASSGLVRYSYSSDGGASWGGLDNGVLWDNTVGADGRYPQGLIYNPAGNTDPNMAYQVFIGPTLESTNGATWGGVGYGSHQIGSTGTTSTDQGLFSDPTNNDRIYIPDGATVANGKIWAVEPGSDAAIDPTRTIATDTLIIYEGDIQGGTISLTRRKIYFPTTADQDPPSSMQIAFSPDGQTGYIVGLGRIDSTAYPKKAVNLLYMKSTDAGVTWGTPAEFYFADDPNVISSIGDSVAADNIASAQFDVDLVVDTFGNPHTIMNIEWRPNSEYGFTYVGNSSTIWHVFSDDGGSNWRLNRLGTTHLRYGALGADPDNVFMQNRPQISRDVRGRYIMMGWFDTDTTIFFPPSTPECENFSSGFCGNCQRTMFYRGYNAAKDVYSDSTRLVTSSFGLMTYEYISEISIRTATGIEIPMVYQVPEWYTRPTGGATWPVVEHYYESGIIVTYEDLGDANVSGLEANAKSLQSMNVYPNPVDGQLYVNIDSRTNGPVTVDVMNLLGKKAMETELRSIELGSNEFSLDLSGLNNGVYLIRIGAGGEFITQKIVVE